MALTGRTARCAINTLTASREEQVFINDIRCIENGDTDRAAGRNTAVVPRPSHPRRTHRGLTDALNTIE
jgi:hypothetical protein